MRPIREIAERIRGAFWHHEYLLERDRAEAMAERTEEMAKMWDDIAAGPDAHIEWRPEEVASVIRAKFREPQQLETPQEEY